MPALTSEEYGDALLAELQTAGATKKEVVAALNELIYAATARSRFSDAPYEFDLALRTYIALP